MKTEEEIKAKLAKAQAKLADAEAYLKELRDSRMDQDSDHYRYHNFRRDKWHFAVEDLEWVLGIGREDLYPHDK